MSFAKGPVHFRIHHFLGLFLGTFAGIVCLTGSVAVVSHELQWLFVPETRAASGTPDTSLGDRWDAACSAYPEILFGGIAVSPTESGVEDYFATTVRGVDEGGGEFRAYVDPVGGEVLGASRGVSFPMFMRALHYYLFDVTGAGFYVVGILGPALLVMMVTGLRTYRGWRKGFAKWPRSAQRPRSWWGSLHRLMGVWSLLSLPVIGLTVVWYLLEWDGLLQWEDPELAKGAAVLPDIRAVSGEDIDRWVGTARQTLPGLQVANLWLPWEEGTAVSVSGQAGDLLVRERANSVEIDPVSGEVLRVNRVSGMGWKERWVHTADPLHFGGFAGLWSKLFWSASGLLLSALCFSGVAVYCLRTSPAKSPRP
jgi:uncharacterized iron-regulated membrane protein